MDSDNPEKQEYASGIHSVWFEFDRFIVPDAAALIADIDPRDTLYGENHQVIREKYYTRTNLHKIKKANEAFVKITESIKSGNLKARHFDFPNIDISFFCKINQTSGNHWKSVAIEEDDLVEWLIEQKIKPPFFAHKIDEKQRAMSVNDMESYRQDMEYMERIYEEEYRKKKTESKARDYLDPENPRYAPKLAAAIRAWEAVEDPKGKHPAQAIREWLTSNAKELGLLKDDGKPSKSAIEDIAKIANWQPKGGAPKTPGK